MREKRLVFRAFPLLILCLWLFSCSTKGTNDKYEYEKGLTWYLNEEFNIKMESIDLENLLFIDVSCEDCMASKVNFLSIQKFHQNFKIFFLGDTTGSELVQRYQNKESKFDLSSKYLEYETGISLPLYIKIINGEITKYQFISEENKDSLVHKMQTSEFF